MLAKLALPRLSSDTQRYHSPMSTGGESMSSVPTRSSVQLLPVGVWLAWSGFAPFSPSSSPQSPLVDARERPHASPVVVPPRRPSYVLLFTSHGTSVQLLKPTPALRPVFLVPTHACIATRSCAHATAYPNPERSSRSS